MVKSKVVIFGAGGVVGQNMIHSQPSDIDAVYCRTLGDDLYQKFCYGEDSVHEFLSFYRPNIVLNLAGENRVDIVESTPDRFISVNEEMPKEIADWCNKNNSYFIQGSTQAVFSGEDAPYSTKSKTDPIVEYGRQKANAEAAALNVDYSSVVRLTFVLGSRYNRSIGRTNPFEDIMEKDHQLQVDDRFFSPLFAHDAAKSLWNLMLSDKNSVKKIYHLGHPIKCSRFSLASDIKYNLHGILQCRINGVSHEYFSGLASRPYNTTWDAKDCVYNQGYEMNIIDAFSIWSKINDKYK